MLPDVLRSVKAAPEEVGHAYGCARNAVSRVVSKHCKISVATALEVCFCTCPVAGTRSCRSIILGSRIVEMGLLLCICGAAESKLCRKSELNPEHDQHDPEDGILSSCCSITQRAMKLGLVCWMKVERRLIPVMCICGGDTPIGFGATEL